MDDLRNLDPFFLRSEIGALSRTGLNPERLAALDAEYARRMAGMDQAANPREALHEYRERESQAPWTPGLNENGEGRRLDEVAAARENKREREIADRLDQREWMLQHPQWPGHANENSRASPEPVKLSPEAGAEVDRLLDQLAVEPQRETLLEKLQREAQAQGRPLEVKLEPQPERMLERRLEKDEDRW